MKQIQNTGQARSVRSALAALPAHLPDVGPIISVEEAISWLAYDAPFFDAEAWENSSRRKTIETSRHGAETHIPAHLLAERDANVTLWDALRSGVLKGFIAPVDGPPLMIPIVYWSRRSSINVDKIYWGRFDGEGFEKQAGVNLPVLLSRREFEPWSKTVAASVGPKAIRKRALNHEEIRGKVAEWLIAQPNLSIGSAALSLSHELPPNQTTGKPRDARHIEKIISDLFPKGTPRGFGKNPP